MINSAEQVRRQTVLHLRRSFAKRWRQTGEKQMTKHYCEMGIQGCEHFPTCLCDKPAVCKLFDGRWFWVCAECYDRKVKQFPELESTAP